MRDQLGFRIAADLPADFRTVVLIGAVEQIGMELGSAHIILIGLFDPDDVSWEMQGRSPWIVQDVVEFPMIGFQPVFLDVEPILRGIQEGQVGGATGGQG